MSNVSRPTSPHLQIYKPQISSVLSILHRITGMALFVGTALLVVWLCVVAYMPGSYSDFRALLASPVGQICLFGWTAAFYYHLGNGVRHLFWDMGKGFTLPAMQRSGWAVVMFAIVMTAGTWFYVYSKVGG